MAGYIVLGFGFGVLLSDAGYGVAWALAMSLLIYAGSMQYVGVSLLTGGATLLTAILTTFMVNARHLFYSISMIRPYQNAGKYKPYMIFALTDETYSLLCDGQVPEDTDPQTYRFLVSLLNHIYWILGSVAGSFLGAVLPFDTTGIDFSMTALFVATFVEQWTAQKDHLSALTGVIASVLSLCLFGPDRFLIPAMLMITAALLLVNLVRERRDR